MLRTALYRACRGRCMRSAAGGATRIQQPGTVWGECPPANISIHIIYQTGTSTSKAKCSYFSQEWFWNTTQYGNSFIGGGGHSLLQQDWMGWSGGVIMLQSQSLQGAWREQGWKLRLAADKRYWGNYPRYFGRGGGLPAGGRGYVAPSSAAATPRV